MYDRCQNVCSIDTEESTIGSVRQKNGLFPYFQTLTDFDFSFKKSNKGM